MVNTIIISEGITLVEAEAQKVSTLGFECEVALDVFPQLRDETGRIRPFQFALFFSDNAPSADVEGELVVYSMRRITQTTGVLAVRFKFVADNGIALLAEYANTGKVVSLEQARQKRRA